MEKDAPYLTRPVQVPGHAIWSHKRAGFIPTPHELDISLNISVIIYLEDILVYSDDQESHVRLVWTVLTRLWESMLYAKLKKCKFHTTQVEFLGYFILPNGVKMDPTKKIKAVIAGPIM